MCTPRIGTGGPYGRILSPCLCVCAVHAYRLRCVCPLPPHEEVDSGSQLSFVRAIYFIALN